MTREAAGSPVVVFNRVTRAFSGVPVLRGVDLSLAPGGSTFIVGPSGCGKSVLMKTIVGMEIPDSGTVSVFGVPVPREGSPELMALRRRAAFVPQHPALFDSMDAVSNIALPLIYHRIADEPAARESAAGLLESFGLSGRLHDLPGQMNQSDRKIVSILRSLALSPELLILDEPTTGLDAPARHAVDSMIVRLGAAGGSGTTLIVVSHDMTATMSIADRVVFLYNGVVRIDGRPGDFAAAALTDPIAAQFLSGAADGPMTSGDED